MLLLHWTANVVLRPKDSLQCKADVQQRERSTEEPGKTDMRHGSAVVTSIRRTLCPAEGLIDALSG